PFENVTSWTDSGFPRQIEGEGAALAGRALHPYIAALAGGDLPGQIQPDAQSLRLAGIRPAVKPAKNAGLLCFWNAGAGALDADRREHLIRTDFHRHTASDGSIFDGVVQQVAEGFFGPFGVKAGAALHLTCRQL